MIEVRSYRSDRRVDTAYAEDPEAAIVAARTLWDEAFTGIQGTKRRVDFYVNGKLIRMLEHRP